MFIELTPDDGDSRNGLLVRADMISTIRAVEIEVRDRLDLYTMVCLNDGSSLEVKEEPKEIIHLIAKAKVMSSIPPSVTVLGAWEQLVVSK